MVADMLSLNSSFRYEPSVVQIPYILHLLSSSLRITCNVDVDDALHFEKILSVARVECDKSLAFKRAWKSQDFEAVVPSVCKHSTHRQSTLTH